MISKDEEWLERAGFTEKDGKWIFHQTKEHGGGLVLEVVYNEMEGLWYCKPVGPELIDIALNVRYFTSFNVTAKQAVDDFIKLMTEAADKMKELVEI